MAELEIELSAILMVERLEFVWQTVEATMFVLVSETDTGLPMFEGEVEKTELVNVKLLSVTSRLLHPRCRREDMSTPELDDE